MRYRRHASSLPASGRECELGGLPARAVFAQPTFLATRLGLTVYVLAFLVGTVQGGTQALSRSLFASMVPKHKAAEFFGFYSTSARFAGILGPALFGLLGQLMGHSRLSILSLVAFFLIGGLVLTRVDVAGARRAASRWGLRSTPCHW